MPIEGATVDLELENQRLRAQLEAQAGSCAAQPRPPRATGDAERRRLEHGNRFRRVV